MSEKPKHSEIPGGPSRFVGRCWEQIRLSWLLFGDNRVSLPAKLIPIVALAYLLSPFGLIPALIPIIGQIDVLAVILITVALFNGAAPQNVKDEYLAQLRTGTKASWKIEREEGGTVIDNRMHFVDEDAPEDSSEQVERHDQANTKRGVV